ncbi:MAG: CreA family protein [Burkholderiaceae bacterium]
MFIRSRSLGVALCALAFSSQALYAEGIGEVSTAFKLLGANHKIVLEAFDDPKVQGVSCFLSRAKKGGVSGTLGLATDPADASIACRQTGPVKYLDKLEAGEEVFKQRTSVLFKTMQVVRFFDPKRNTLVYLTYSDKLIDGSPKNSLSAVAIAPWGPQGEMPAAPAYKE